MRNRTRILICVIIAALVLLSMPSCGSGSDQPHTIKFSDGSMRIYTTYEYGSFHLLYDNVGIYMSPRSVSHCIMKISDDMSVMDKNFMKKVIDTKALTTISIFEKYAFSDKGYVAYYEYTEGLTQYCVYSVPDAKITKFGSVTELYKYAESNGFSLGEWYYPFISRFAPQEQVAENNNWSMFTTSGEISAVRNGYEDMFCGEIDKFLSSGSFLAFHIVIDGSTLNDLKAFENPVLPCDESSEPIRYTFFWRNPVYCDRYVIVDTKNDSYQFFNKKADAENYLEADGISVDWEKVSYEGRYFQ